MRDFWITNYKRRCFQLKNNDNQTFKIFVTSSEKKYRLELEEDNIYVLNNIGSIYEGRKDYDKSLYYLKKSLEASYEYYLSHFNIAVVYKEMEKTDLAVKV